ncbi:uncharacterized protein SAPINGB_P002177 [Magnusiomyces paraingens]|uniref:DUF1868 domain-containing protein n=1 Tax=Magnusiomyces paraingens TaxID=2606893 RepID=A0A5E8BI78_9ASCO|nr:uncharacterized protein SAPINGB_P002177 [Saprochaete ingens]VVT49248.1 unnamed protein product [Saprochaete ingens]
MITASILTGAQPASSSSFDKMFSSMPLSTSLSSSSSCSSSDSEVEVTSQTSSARTSISDEPLPGSSSQDSPIPTNPYTDLIRRCPTPKDMAKAYETHRRNRNAEKLRQMSHLKTVSPDSILAGLVLHDLPQESDPRNNITIWSRPTVRVMDLIAIIQQQLIDTLHKTAPSHALQKQPPVKPNDPANKGPLWLMPRECLHLSVLEVTHSAPPDVIDSQIKQLKPYLSEILTSRDNAPILVKPLVCFDSAAFALTFAPLDSSLQKEYGAHSEDYTYTHYRAHLYNAINKAQVYCAARYEVPSAHVTIARFIEEVSPNVVDALLETIQNINTWLEDVYSNPESFSWQVGSERGTECRCGRIWYGGGWTEATGETVEELKNEDSWQS